MDADGDIVLRPLWRRDDPQTIADVKRLWAAGGIPAASIESRQKELCAAAYIGDELAAVSTAGIYFDPAMRNNFFAYRCMVAPQFRRRNLAWRISAYSLDLLKNWSAQNPEARILGLMIVVETEKFAEGLRSPIRENFGVAMHFVGYTMAGQQLRVVWFDDAKLDDAAAVRRGLGGASA